MSILWTYLSPMKHIRPAIDPALIEDAKAIAKAEHRSLTAHINLLIAEDIRRRRRNTKTNG